MIKLITSLNIIIEKMNYILFKINKKTKYFFYLQIIDLNVKKGIKI